MCSVMLCWQHGAGLTTHHLHCTCTVVTCSLWACLNFFGGGVVGSTALARVGFGGCQVWCAAQTLWVCIAHHNSEPSFCLLFALVLPLTCHMHIQVPEFINKPLETPQLLGYALPGGHSLYHLLLLYGRVVSAVDVHVSCVRGGT